MPLQAPSTTTAKGIRVPASRPWAIRAQPASKLSMRWAFRANSLQTAVRSSAVQSPRVYARAAASVPPVITRRYTDGA